MAGKFGDIIQKAREQESQLSGQPENQITDQQEDQLSGLQENQIASEPEVNLCVKVPKSLRHHWAVEAKRTGVTMTSVIIEALSQKFGLPEDQ
jgi:hypothetical protein